MSACAIAAKLQPQENLLSARMVNNDTSILIPLQGACVINFVRAKTGRRSQRASPPTHMTDPHLRMQPVENGDAICIVKRLSGRKYTLHSGEQLRRGCNSRA